MIVTKSLNLPEVLIIEPRVYRDDRGLFFESFQSELYTQQGITENFVQDNFSRSKKDVLRGLHYQKHHTQGKLIFVTRGKILDVVVDIRRNSPTFGQATTIMIDDQNYRQVYIPPGYAHGFCVLSDQVDFIYKCTDYYDPSSEKTVLWNDPDLNIVWPTETPILSEKDQRGLLLKDIPPEDLPLWSPKQ